MSLPVYETRVPDGKIGLAPVFEKPALSKDAPVVEISELPPSESECSPCLNCTPISRAARLRSKLSVAAVGGRKAWRNRIFVGTGVLLFLGGLAAVFVYAFPLGWPFTNRSRTYFSLIITLIRRVTPHAPSNGLQRITQGWRTPSDSVGAIADWPEDFSRDIVPIACHSHNDYWRRVPLYDALYAGCTGVEADVWLGTDDGGTPDLFVGHTIRGLRPERTLRSLYVDPLVRILENMNRARTAVHSNASSETGAEAAAGVFDTDPTATLTLLIDFKSDGAALWPVVSAQLAPLREQGWLSYWNASDNGGGGNGTVVRRPITVVGTGNTPFERVISNSTYRDIFFDAPLDQLSAVITPSTNTSNDTSRNSTSTASHEYSVQNSWYASTSLGRAIGRIGHRGLTPTQRATVQSLVDAAAAKGLQSRFWDTPAWPVSRRDEIWRALVESGVGMLNLDDLRAGTMWNWNWCVVAGLVLC